MINIWNAMVKWITKLCTPVSNLFSKLYSIKYSICPEIFPFSITAIHENRQNFFFLLEKQKL